jgi:beta-lactamase superfamily II metal-dependent hydrolase
MKRHISKFKITIIAALLITFCLSACGKQQVQTDIDSLEDTDNTQTTSDSSVEVTSTASTDLEVLDTTLTITCIKGGAADAFVLISDNHVVVIDTGLDKKADKLVEFLNEQGVTKVDELIITHFDKDHVGGADHILNNFEVGTVYTTYHSKESDDITAYLEALENCGLEETTVSENLTFSADGISFTIYPPQSPVYYDSTSNNSSLVIRVSLGENSMLFAGDAEYERLSELLKTEGLGSTILKVPHHGRYNANSEAFIKYVNPQYAVITSSNGEPEDQQVLDILAANGTETYLTKEGNITITMTADGVEISQQK